jgi:phage terminase large subunit
MKTTTVFERNLIEYKKNSPLIVNQGGTRSSKTYSILQLLTLIAEKSHTPLVISVVSRALPHLKLGAMRDMDNILMDLGYIPDKIKNHTDNYYRVGKSIIEFFGTDNIGKVHGPSRDILFGNECNYIKYDIFDHLAVRTGRTIFLDFNPNRAFWFHTEIQGKQRHSFIKSTYLDNEHLTRDQIERIEAKKHNPYWWQVYGLGELGKLEGSIFDWTWGEFDNSLPFAYGLDFGVKDPDAMVKVAIDKLNKKIYWKQELYQNSLSTPQLGQMIKARGVGNSLIIADSASLRTIIDLRAMGLNIAPVKKPRIVDRIKFIWDYELIVDPGSFDLEKELNTYVWLDKKGEIPIDEDNHLCDAGGYCSYYFSPNYGKGSYVIQT